ncbi:PKD domain-containing protein [Dyadobacter sp. CY351]|uniref:PKD domain-containing protein n=1 Tax=Dyadobacter sp. CY351 TaxID=2909337 RepID=UPI001F1AD37A|nr:PKD domain-containing protein [Dyadobacter sp. CY351]MCF2518574.1 PKD domain-containing protein [Dyadobacter sp. CY351]
MRRILIQLLLLAIVFGCHQELPPQPVAKFTFTNGGCTAPCSVTFTSDSENATSLEWDFNDRSEIQSGKTVTHEFVDGKNYYVKLIAKSADGGSHGETQTVVIEAKPAAPPVADFDMTPKNGGVAPLKVSFDNQSKNAATYKWRFGDKYASPADPDSSTIQSPSHTYSVPGTYTVTLTAYNAEGKPHQKTKTFEVKAEGPTASFTMDKTECEAPCEVTFTNTSTKADSYKWDFSDGSTSIEKSPKHTFNTPGTYVIVLTAKGPGGEDPETKTLTVKAKLSNAIAIKGTYNYPTHMLSDAVGNIYVCGAMTGTADFGNGKVLSTGYSNGNLDFFIAKYNTVGECLWAYSDGSSSDDIANGIGFDDSGNVYLTGSLNGIPRKSQGFRGGFVAKLTRDGSVTWFQSFGGPGNISAEGKSVGFYQTTDGPRIYMAGTIKGVTGDKDILFGNRSYAADDQDVVLVFLDADNGSFGTPLIVGGPNAQFVSAMVIDNEGSAYITGTFDGAMSFSGRQSRLSGSGRLDAFVAKWNLARGDWEWAIDYGFREDDYGYDIAINQQKELCFAMTETSSGDPALHYAKINANGQYELNGSSFGLDGWQVPGGITITPAGQVVLASSFTGKGTLRGATFDSRGNSDVLIAELKVEDPYVGKLYAHGGGAGEDRSIRVCLAPDGTVYNTGWFTGTATFNNTELVGASASRNTYIVKYKY